MSLKIDVHHHIFAPFFMQAKLDTAEEVGWRTPPENLPWSLSKSLAMMDQVGIGAAILSYPAGIPEKMGKHFDSKTSEDGGGDASDSDEVASKKRGRDAVRNMNVYAKNLCESEEAQGRFGWFACLPDLNDGEGSLREIKYALDELHADGVSLSSSYGEGPDGVYLGESRFEAIWEELNNRSAVVFIHGTQTASSKPYPHETLGLPVTEVPGETFKAAAHLVVTGTKRRYPKVKIILAHFGGSMPALVPRVAALSVQMGGALSADEVIQDLCSFYLESALSTHDNTLRLAEALVGKERILFGTDFPAANLQTISWFTKNVEEYYAGCTESFLQVTNGTAAELFPRFGDQRK